MRAQEYIDSLAEAGRYHFSTAAAIEAMGGDDDAVRAQLRRLKAHGRIASPMRSFHVIVPPEYRRMGCLPGEHFLDQLMESLGEPYYIGLLSAAERHGAAHQRPQSLQVMVPRNRPSVACGQVLVQFIARGDMARMPVSTFKTPRGYLRYATPEVTALELVGYPQHAGGLHNVATVLAELSEELDVARLMEAAKLHPIGWCQRLGYLLDRVGDAAHANALAPLVHQHAHSYIPLRRSASTSGAPRDGRWKVVVNVDVEPDL